MTEYSAKYLKQAIVAALCEHPDAEKYRKRAFSGDNLAETIEVMSRETQTLTTADFLAADDNGVCFLDAPGAWKNFDKIVKTVGGNGGYFTCEDFTKPLGKSTSKTLLDSARTHNALANVFSFAVWQGHYEEMERLWYKVPVPNRKDLFQNQGLISAELKRQLFAVDGKATPEDRLAKAGLSLMDVRAAFSAKNGITELSDKLKLAGDYLRKEYILATDSFGDTVFDSKPDAWDKYNAVVDILAENGERLEVADFTRRIAFVKSILGRAAEHRTLNKVFTPAHWTDRLQDMLTLWSHVLDGWKTSAMTVRDFDNAYAEAESATYAKIFQSLAVTGKTDLLKNLDTGSVSAKPVLPLGLKAVWDKFDSVQAALKKLDGEALTVDDLRTTSGEMGNSCLVHAAKFGHFDKVIDISMNGGGILTVKDFLTKDCHGEMLINLLAEKKQLEIAFAPDLWAGRVSEMKDLWSHVKGENRAQMDFDQAKVKAQQATLKLKKGGIKFQPRDTKKN